MRLVFFAFALTACTTQLGVSFSSVASDGYNTPTPDMAEPRNLTMQSIGDSTSYGGTTHGEPAQGAWRRPLWQTARANNINLQYVGSLSDPYPFWPALGSHDHDAHDGYSCTELLYGRTTSPASVGLRAGQWTAQMKPKIVFVMCGANDLRRIANCCTPAQLQSVAAAMIAVADEVHAQSPSTKVWMSNLINISYWGKTNFVAQVNNALTPLFATRPWLGFIDTYNIIARDGVGGATGSDQDDGLHPNAGGYAKIAAALWSATNGLTP